jgi:transposase InsO family protein
MSMGVTAAAFWHRARAFFAAHGISRITRVITDNGGCYRSAIFARAICEAGRHQRIRPFTPRHNGKVCEDLGSALCWSRSDSGKG